jgi:hypothetical protein
MKNLVLVLDLLLIYCSLYSAPVPVGGVAGTIIDAETAEPLAYTNVFFTNTTFGDAADSEGEFLLERVPAGAYQLIVSRIGYELFVKDVAVRPERMEQLKIALKVQSIAGKEISVTARHSKEWKHDLKLFERYFLGVTTNANKCSILNPEVLSFEKSAGTGDLLATAEGALTIENRALGYKIEMILSEFRYGFAGGKYVGYPRYYELDAKTKRQQKRWQKARRNTFFDSIRGLFYAVSLGRRQDAYMISLRNRKSIHHFVALSNVDLETTVVDSMLAVKRFKAFDRLHVQNNSGDASDLYLKYGYVDFDANGNIYPADAITVSGYWVKNRIADTLPFDYAPMD